MTEAEYRALCLACDRALLAGDSTIERVAISWLHVVREHPVFLRQYEDLFTSDGLVTSALKGLGERARSAARRARRSFQARVQRGERGRPRRNLPAGADLLFVSHMINASHAGASEDFYFGSLPGRLVERGTTCVVALIDQRRGAIRDLADAWTGGLVPRVLLSPAADPRTAQRLGAAVSRVAAGLLASARQATGLERRVLQHAAEHAAEAISVLVLAEQIGTLVAALRPRAIIVTHEGHAWERVAFAVARRAMPEVRCIGYQHAAVFRMQHAIRRGLQSEYNPDVLLTSGAVARDRLRLSPGLRDTPVAVLGSARAFRTIDLVRRGRQAADRGCVVLPEGIESECDLLFEFALECALAAPHISFIWRMHPILPFEAIQRANPKLRKLPANVEVSMRSLDEDLDRSAWAIYRGTTAIVPAVLAGVRPFYLCLPDELTIDPLYDLVCWKRSIYDHAEVLRAIAADLTSDASALATERAAAVEYCRRYFDPWDADALLALLPPRETFVSAGAAVEPCVE